MLRTPTQSKRHRLYCAVEDSARLRCDVNRSDILACSLDAVTLTLDNAPPGAVIDTASGHLTSTNRPPEILSNVSGSIQLGQTFLHQLKTVDLDGDPLSYSLTSFLAGMTISAEGLIQWTPASKSRLPPHWATSPLYDSSISIPAQTRCSSTRSHLTTWES